VPVTRSRASWSGYLHSAAMVAAGVLVLGRVHPLLARSDRDARVPANVGSNASTIRTTARVSVASTPHRAPTFCTNAGVTSPTTRTVAAARASASASGG
jgi:hypothetical protein